MPTESPPPPSMPAAPDLPEALNLADWFLAARLREGHGARTAIRAGDDRLTYADVGALAARFAHVLRGLGVEQEQRVVIALPDVPEFAGAFFGIQELGAVVVMVNPQLPPDEIAYFYRYARARAAIVHADTLAAFDAARAAAAPFPRTLLVVGARGGAGSHPHPSFEREAASAPARFEPVATHRDDAAVWLFSGGTTGRPKAVVQTHASFANTTALYARRWMGYAPDDVTLSVPKLYFGYATGSNLLFPFSVGAACVLFPERATADAIFGQVRRHRPSILVNVPTMVKQMVDHPEARAQDLSCLRFATSAGEALPPALHARWQETFGVDLCDGLGTAEMWHVFLSNRPGAVRPGTLGRAVDGFELRLCGPDGGEVAPGEVGTLRVRGGSRALGYWQDARRSHEAFRGEWYVSGDLLTRDADGWYTYCGRGDDMLKVGGKWVAPQELEDCLLRHPGVKECAVVGASDAAGLCKPVAFVVPARAQADAAREAATPAAGDAPREADALADALRRWVGERLERYKAPRAVLVREELPRTHLGKVDRGALRRDAEAALGRAPEAKPTDAANTQPTDATEGARP